ncbi:transposase family protein [Streptomyces sp. NPDC001709]
MAEALTRHHADGYVLPDGTVAETDRVRAPGHTSGKASHEGVNRRSSQRKTGNDLAAPPAAPHDLTAAREHAIVNTCAPLGLKLLADKGYVRAGGTVITPVKRRPKAELPDKHKASNKVHAALRAPVERTISRIKHWRIFRHAGTSPNILTSAAAAVFTSWSTREKGSVV